MDGNVHREFWDLKSVSQNVCKLSETAATTQCCISKKHRGSDSYSFTLVSPSRGVCSAQCVGEAKLRRHKAKDGAIVSWLRPRHPDSSSTGGFRDNRRTKTAAPMNRIEQKIKRAKNRD
eukprot:scaffold278_cov195-Amphora_coffeaeformis.AAC.12